MGTLVSALTFIVAGLLCLITHELGHALVGRALAGGQPQILMTGLGGDCCNAEARFTRSQGIIMTAAGPMATLLLGLLAFIVLYVIAPNMDEACALASDYACGNAPESTVGALSVGMLCLLRHVIYISFWWTMLNLLPIYPLDGGQIMSGICSSMRTVFCCSLIVSVVVFLVTICLGWWLVAPFMLALGYINYRGMRATAS